jgi:hypothetical protein
VVPHGPFLEAKTLGDVANYLLLESTDALSTIVAFAF